MSILINVTNLKEYPKYLGKIRSPLDFLLNPEVKENE